MIVNHLRVDLDWLLQHASSRDFPVWPGSKVPQYLT
jgi:hypothetical protein